VTAATPTLERPQVLSPDNAIVFDFDTSMEHEPVCEAKPNGKRCFRPAAVSAFLTDHGPCIRAGKAVLMCKVCFDKIRGGQVCAECDSDQPIFILSAVDL
jgi:hypothetical protein